MKLNKLLSLLAATAAAFGLAACADTDAQYSIPDVAAPQLVSTYPENGSTVSEPGDITMTVKYDKKVFFASEQYTQLSLSGGTIDQAAVYGTDSVLTIHATGLTRGTTCTLTIPAGLVTGPNQMPAPEVSLSFSVKSLPPVASAPVAATSAEAVKLYNFLRENYREKVVSGMMANVAWNTDESEKVYQWTGRYPAINGFDYIHLPASVRGANWIDYGDISPVQQWSEQGGIVCAGWHWLAPKRAIGSGDEPDTPDTPTEGEETIWEGTLNLGKDWSVSDQIAASKFANATEGTVLTVYFSENSDADYWQAKIMDSSWNALTSYKDVDNGWGCIDFQAGATTYSLALNAADVESLKASGAVISGYGITYQKLTLATPADVRRTGRRHTSYDDLNPNSDFGYEAGVFSLTNAVTEGTWENQFVKDDLARIASYLKLLRDAGIPVLWRPLHEASGGWFWWGSNAEAYKKLWVMMFDYFKAEGLNNLVWVWTSEGSDANWYPGAEYVDIIGRDLYGNGAASCAQEYQKLADTFEGKIITLSECGYSEYTGSTIATISEQLEAGVQWSWFMPWYTAENHSPEAWWQDAMSNPAVLSRDQIPSFK